MECVLEEMAVAVSGGNKIEVNQALQWIQTQKKQPLNALNIHNLISLACKDNRPEILEFLLSKDASVPSWCIQDEEGHNAVYYAIRSSNVHLLQTLLSSLTQPEPLEKLLSMSYMDLILKNVYISSEMELFIQYKLMGLRFFSKGEELPYSSTDILERVQLLVKNISTLSTEYSQRGVDEKFIYMAKFIAKNIHILKQKLMSTYNVLPWEEIEFCLVCFVSAHTKTNEMNIFYLTVLRKGKLLEELRQFAEVLQSLEEHIRCLDVRKLCSKVNESRSTVVADIIKKYPQTQNLYDDFQEIRDIYSLDIMKTYIDAALLADSATREGQLTIKGTLQVIGEHLKSTLYSPKLSAAESHLLLLAVPKETRKVLTKLRNSISHVHTLPDNTETEYSRLYYNIQIDIQKIGTVILNTNSTKKIKKLKFMLNEIIKCDDLDYIKEIMNIFQSLDCDVEELLMQRDPTITEYTQIESLVNEISIKVVEKNPFEDELLIEITNVLNRNKSTHKMVQQDFMTAVDLVKFEGFNPFRKISQSTKSIYIAVEAWRFVATQILNNLELQEHSIDLKPLNLVIDLLKRFYCSVKLRIRPAIASEILFLIVKIIHIAYEKCNIKWINKYSEQLETYGEKKKKKKKRSNTTKNAEEIISKQLKLNHNELRELVGCDGINNLLLKFNNNNSRFAMETLVLDIITLAKECFDQLPNNILYLDDNMPLLTGTCFRNHLAHKNPLVDILLTDPWSAVLLNALNLTENKLALTDNKKGIIFKHDVKQLIQKYQQGLNVINIQEDMCKALIEGNIEDLKASIIKGADAYSKRLFDLTTMLHIAAQGPSIETFVYFTKKFQNTYVTDIHGQTPLHIAATFGRDSIVKFLVEKLGFGINEVDKIGNTPLHLASQNGHKITVETLLSLGSDTTVRDKRGNSPLHHAVAHNNLDVVILLLEKNVTFKDDIEMRGFTYLHVAAYYGYPELVRYFINNGADVNAKSLKGAQPLHLAAISGHLEVVKILIENAAKINHKISNGCTPLIFAVVNCHEEIVNILLDHGALNTVRDLTYYSTPLHLAVANGFKVIVEILLQNKANVNARRLYRTSPLLVAAREGYDDIVHLLLQNGAPLDAKDVNGVTALHYSAMYGRASTVKNLIKRGIGIDTQCSLLLTPLHLAVQHGHQECVDILLDAAASVNSVAADGYTPLHFSSLKGHEAISATLIKSKAVINSRDVNGFTPLHKALGKTICNENIVQLLLKHKADANANGKLKMTALHLAAHFGHSRMVKALLEKDADMCAVTTGGDTPLHLAATGNHTEVINVLLKHGCDVNSLDKQGYTVLCYAAQYNNKELLDILIANGADVNAAGGVPLKSAVLAGHKTIVEALLKHKDININVKDHDQFNLLHRAATNGEWNIGRMLIEKGLEVDSDCTTLNNATTTPLLLAILNGHTEFVSLLLQKGAIVNPILLDSLPLHVAVTKNNSEIVRHLLLRGAEPDTKNIENKTPLELAVFNSHIKNINLLLECPKVNINNRGFNNWTVLHIAVQSGNIEVVKLLVEQDADINAKNSSGSKPIHIAAIRGHQNILEFFLGIGMSIGDVGENNQTLLHYSALAGHASIAQYLIGEGANVNAADTDYMLPIHLSALRGHKEVLNILSCSGAIFDGRRNIYGKKPCDLTVNKDIKEILESIEKLFEAVKRNDISSLRVLIGGFSKYLDVKNSDNYTLLHIASRKGFQEVSNILLTNKANPNAVGKGGNVPLHYASKFSHFGIVKSLLKKGAKFNIKADNGKTPLDVAKQENIIDLLQIVTESFRKVQSCDLTLIKDLMENDVHMIGAILKAANTADGNTLLAVAKKNNFPEVDKLGQILEEHHDMQTENIVTKLDIPKQKYDDAVKTPEPEFDERAIFSGTSHIMRDWVFPESDQNLYLAEINSLPKCDIGLMNAASQGDAAQVSSLIQNGSDVNTADAGGRGPLYCAARAGHTDIVMLLLQNGADATASTTEHDTVLHAATTQGCVDTVRILLKNVSQTKPDAYSHFINAKTAVEGATALHIAAKSGSIDIVKCLLKHGSCYNHPDRSDNLTPLEYSQSVDVTELLELVWELFASVERGDTQLLLSAENQVHFETILNSRDTQNRTPLQVANIHGNKTIAQLISGILKSPHF